MILNKNDIIIFRKKHLIENLPHLSEGEWLLGRQNALYTKRKANFTIDLLNSVKECFLNIDMLDLWHLKIQSNIDLHVDECDKFYHYRYNISYKGKYIMNIGDNSYYIEEGDVVLFRSDISLHGIELFDKKLVEIFSAGIFIERH